MITKQCILPSHDAHFEIQTLLADAAGENAMLQSVRNLRLHKQ